MKGSLFCSLRYINGNNAPEDHTDNPNTDQILYMDTYVPIYVHGVQELIKVIGPKFNYFLT
jgi:hypothetical protein